MKIGSFAEKNKITKDTVRHYMDLGILIPKKIGGQYHFTSSNQRDLDEIIHLKKLNFTLNEIKKIFWTQKIGNLSTATSDNFYRETFSQKVKEVQEKIIRLKGVEKTLQGEIDSLNPEKPSSPFKIGVPLTALPLLKCLRCCLQGKYRGGSDPSGFPQVSVWRRVFHRGWYFNCRPSTLPGEISFGTGISF